MGRKAAVPMMFVILLFVACSVQAYDAYMEQGVQALKEDRFGDAVQAFKKAVKAADREEAKRLLNFTKKLKESHDAFLAGEYDAALAGVAKLADMKPKNDNEKIVQEKSKTLMQAVAALKQAQDLEAKLAQGEMLAQEKKYAEAKRVFDDIIASKTNNQKVKKLIEKAKDLKWDVLLAERKQKEKEERRESGQNKKRTGGKITKKEAVALVKKHLHLEDNPDITVLYDHTNEKGDYVIHVYEVVSDGETGHQATLGWYAVDPFDGYVYDALE